MYMFLAKQVEKAGSMTPIIALNNRLLRADYFIVVLCLFVYIVTYAHWQKHRYRENTVINFSNSSNGFKCKSFKSK